MKNLISKICKYPLDLFRRILFLIIEAIIWPVWLVSTGAFILLSTVFYFFGSIILWTFLGADRSGAIMEYLFVHTDEELWHRESYDGKEFVSMIPTWAKWLHNHCLVNILPKQDRSED